MTRSLAHIPQPEARLAELDHRLAQMPAPEAAALLLEALSDPYPPIRRHAAALLASRRTPAIEALVREVVAGRSFDAGAADTPDVAGSVAILSTEEVRSTAVLALRGSHDPETIELLYAIGRGPEADLRYHALLLLFEIEGGERGRLEALVAERLGDPDQEVAIVAAQIAAGCMFERLMPRLIEARARLFGPARLQLTLAICEIAAASSIARADVPEALTEAMTAELIRSLEDERTLEAATHALAALGSQRAIEALERVLERWFMHPILKVGVAAALVELGRDSGREHLARALESRRKDARGYALRIVGRLRLTEHFEHLVHLARSDDYHADTAVLALADFGTPEARAELERIAAVHPDADVQALAGEVLGR